jgi:hypothetical protein
MEIRGAIVEPSDEYHGKAGQYLSSHLLATFRRCPLAYRQQLDGMIENVDSPAFKIGRAAHTMILEGRDVFHDTYAIGGPINEKTGKPYGNTTKAWADWEREVGKPILSIDDLNLVECMLGGVNANAEAADLLSSGVAERVFRARHCDIDCQARVDWITSQSRIVDLKTVSDLSRFEADARRYGYLHQVAFYQAVVQEASDTMMPVSIIAVEKAAPYRCGVWEVTLSVMAHARRENAEQIGKLLACQDVGNWPTGYEEVRTFESLHWEDR